MITTKFDPKEHGFHFDNGNFGGCSSVLCGGMAYAALDYFHCKLKIPDLRRSPATTDPVYDFIFRRQCTAHFYTWNLFRIAWSEPHPNLGTLTNGLSQRNFSELEYYLLSQGPLVMCLYDAFPTGHHVLAIGCDTSSERIELYDNNYHDKRSSITQSNGVWEHSGGGTWRGWFLDWGHYDDGAKLPPFAFHRCTKCHGLCATSRDFPGYCTAGGWHSRDETLEYALPCFVSEGERGWSLCVTCNALFYCSGGKPTGWCVRGNPHVPMPSASGEPIDFGVVALGASGQRCWHKCNSCFSLFRAGNGNGNCTVSGTHEKSTKEYVVAYRAV
jgi:hypothetical protein